MSSHFRSFFLNPSKNTSGFIKYKKAKLFKVRYGYGTKELQRHFTTWAQSIPQHASPLKDWGTSQPIFHIVQNYCHEWKWEVWCSCHCMPRECFRSQRCTVWIQIIIFPSRATDLEKVEQVAGTRILLVRPHM